VDELTTWTFSIQEISKGKLGITFDLH